MATIPNLDLNRYIPGFNQNTATASSNIGTQLAGLPSTGPARQKAAYFGVASGMPNSGVSNALGYDLYGQDAAKQKQQGFENLIAMLTGYSGTVAPTTGQQIQSSQFDQDLAFREEQANAARQTAYDRLNQAGAVANKPRAGRISGPAIERGGSTWWLDQQNSKYR